MKKYFLTISFIFFLLNLSYTQIKVVGNFQNLRENKFLVNKPVNGNFFPMQYEDVAVAENGDFVIELDSAKPGFMSINFGTGLSVKFFVEPGETDSISLDFFNVQRTLKFYGPNARQNEFIKSLPREEFFSGFGKTATEQELKRDEDIEVIYENVKDNLELDLEELEAAAAKNNFSESFMTAMKWDIHYYYVCLFNGIVISEFSSFSRGEESLFDRKWADYWDEMQHLQPASNDEAPVSIWYFSFIERYFGTYRMWFLEEQENKEPDFDKGEVFVEYDKLMRRYFKGHALEYALASMHTFFAKQERYQPLLVDLFENFKKDFPKSPYLPFFEEAVEPIQKYLESVGGGYPEGVHFVKDYGNVSSLEELYAQFPDKVIYIDVWATWCGPCKAQFKFKDGLEEFRTGKDIVPVYISIDKPGKKKQWEDLIKFYKLKGYHILVNEALQKEIYEVFGTDGGISIPQYGIVDKKGKLLNDDAPRPSMGRKLYKELEKALE